MEEKTIEKKQDQQGLEKKVYSPPKLTVYGRLNKLTAGGKANNPEGAGQSQDKNLHP